ncbi:MAG: MFS transporter, partial [Myxococcota bacterium]
MLVALLTIFLDILGFGMIIPIQPFYAESFGADPTLVTLLGATFSAMQFLFSPMWGRLSDRIGRRPVILVSVAIGAFGHLMFALAGQLWVLFLARFITGVGTANFGAAQAVVADTTSGPERARGMGLLGAAFGMGFIIGPAVGGVLSQVSPAAPFWFAAGLSTLNFVLAWRILPETHPVEKRGRRAGPLFALLEIGGAGRFPNLPKLFF